MRHTGLPKVLPAAQKRDQIEIRSLSPLPASRTRAQNSSIFATDRPDRQRESKSQSIHKISSKQKPNCNSSANSSCKGPIMSPNRKQRQVNQFNFPHPKGNPDNQFAKCILEATRDLRASKQHSQYKSQQYRQSLTHMPHKEYRKNTAQKPEIKALRGQPRSLTANRSEQIEVFMTLKHKQWKTYQGESRNNKREGFGVIHFVNGDKFLGNFVEHRAQGHGTYYDTKNGVRVMGLWTDDDLMARNYVILIGL